MPWWTFWRRRKDSPGDGESIVEEPPGDGDQEFDGSPGDGESEEEEFLHEPPELLSVMMWRIRRLDISTVVGVSEELFDDERLWLRVNLDGRGDLLSRDPVIAEVRTGDRARERAESATRKGRGWRIVDGPRTVEIPMPPFTAIDVLYGQPLRIWAYDLAQRFTAGKLQ